MTATAEKWGRGPTPSPEQGDAKEALAEAEPLLHGGYPDDPGPDHDAVGEKYPEHRKPGHAQRRSKPRGRAAHGRTRADRKGGARMSGSRTALTTRTAIT